MGHRKHCPLMGCVGCGPQPVRNALVQGDNARMPDVHDYAAAVAAVMPELTGAEHYAAEPVPYCQHGCEQPCPEDRRGLTCLPDREPPEPRFQRIEDTA